MTRITLVMAGDEEGGLEKHVVELTNGLAGQGDLVNLIAHEKYRSRVVPNVGFFAVDLSKSRRNPLVLWQLYKTIKKTQPDVIHVHANKAVNMVAPLLKWLDVPSVATLHGIKKNLKAYQKFDRIIAVSQRAAAALDTNKVRVVWNGVALPEVSGCAIPAKAPVQAIAIGRLVLDKGFDLLIEAWQGLAANLWIVGDGPEQAALQEKINHLGLQDRISLLGYRDNIAGLIAVADVLVISSRREGGPYTLAEALLTERPVLATNVGMVAEALPPALICEPDHVAALHQLLDQHLTDLSGINDMSQPAYQFAQKHLSFEAMLDKTIAVYQELLPDVQD